MEGAVILSTSGVAAEYMGPVFGLYTKENVTANGASVYRQLGDDGAKVLFLFRGPFDTWFIGEHTHLDFGYLYNDQKSTFIPRTGWKYNDDGWHKDSGIKVEDLSDVDQDSICYSVQIKGDSEEYNQYMGQYDAIDFSAGRLVFKNEENGKFLKVKDDEVEWHICEDLECSSGSVISSGGGANSMNPADKNAESSKKRFPNQKSWGHYDGEYDNEYNGTWINLNIDVECLF